MRAPLALALSLLVLAPATAAERKPNASAPGSTPPAGSAPAPAAPLPPAEKLDPTLFDRALAAYFAGDFKEAAPKLYAFLEAAPQTDDNRAWAQLFLAKSLLDLGLTHAGTVYLTRIARERTNPAVVPRALEELQKLTERPHDETLVDQQVFGALDLGFLPESVAAFAHYQQGLMDLRVGNERWAQTHFSKLPEGSKEASQARFVTLVSRLKKLRGDVPQQLVDEFLAAGRDEKLNRATRNEAMLAVARLRYERKDFAGALEAYREVVLPPLDPGRAALYLEEAWTRYQLGQVHAAMGLLTTLDAPSFRDEFLPDKYLLRALIYRDLCHYLPAKRAAKELTRRYADSLEAIAERMDLTQDVRLRRAAISTGETQRAAQFVEALSLEGERLGRYAGSFGARLHAHLTQIYDLAHAEARRVEALRLEESVRAQADRLLRAAEQVRLMEYEVGLKLYERIKRGARRVSAPEEEALSPAQVAFRFEGEYWNDELRDYRFSLASRCLEEGAP